MSNCRSTTASLPQIAMTLVLGLALAACFDPNRPENLNCSAEGLCPGSMVCQVDNICRSVGGSDDSDARGLAVDAAPDFDALPYACSSTSDCQSPPDLCYMPGVCDIDTNLCVFPKMGCPANETCATHQCNPSTGQCETAATNEDAICAAQSCAAYGACTFEAGVCDESGTETRVCTDSTCAGGACVAVESNDSKPCSRMTEGNSCGFQNCNGPGSGDGIQEVCCSAGSCNDACDICEPIF